MCLDLDNVVDKVVRLDEQVSEHHYQQAPTATFHFGL